MARMRTDRFRAMYAAAKAIAARRLPSLAVEMKWAYLLRSWQVVYDATEKHQREVQLDFIKGAEGEAKSLDNPIGMQVALAKFAATEIAVPLPKKRFTKDDLPKEMDGEKGDANREGIAALVADLGPLFEVANDQRFEFEAEPDPAPEAVPPAPNAVAVPAGAE